MKPWIVFGCLLTALAIAQNQQLLVKVDFASKDRLMKESSQADWEASYTDGAMRMVIRTDQALAESRPSFRAGNVRLEVDATKINASNSSLVGIFCRLNQDGSYVFGLNAERSMAFIQKNWKGDSTLLARINIPVTVPLYRENRYNRLTVDCISDKLSFSVNGYLIGSATDNANMGKGEMGIWADRNDPQAQAVAFFDNFAAWSFDPQ